MVPKKSSGKMIGVCPRCGYKSSEVHETGIKEHVAKAKIISIVEEEKIAHPLVDAECPKCGHGQAYFWEIQTRAADEPATQFFRCEKCRHTWRRYD